jgi:uncharacterized FlaG/YvyC family protein
MSFEVPPVGKIQQTSATEKAAAAQPAGRVEPIAQAVEVDVADVSIPATPPEELREEMAAAAERVDQMKAMGREIHFERDLESGRVVIEVRDLNGNVIRTIPPSHMLDVLAGAPLEV